MIISGSTYRCSPELASVILATIQTAAARRLRLNQRNFSVFAKTQTDGPSASMPQKNANVPAREANQENYYPQMWTTAIFQRPQFFRRCTAQLTHKIRNFTVKIFLIQHDFFLDNEN
ncbi:MAG TPA: hypothetical protein VGA09_06575 [Candidatus Binatia bacterium]